MTANNKLIVIDILKTHIVSSQIYKDFSEFCKANNLNLNKLFSPVCYNGFVSLQANGTGLEYINLFIEKYKYEKKEIKDILDTTKLANIF